MKLVDMQPGRNPAPNFFLYTESPVAGHGVGFILDDMSSEFDVNAPTFGEKHAPPHLPVSVQDLTGREVEPGLRRRVRVVQLPGAVDLHHQSAVPVRRRPNMLSACMNSPGPIADPSGATNPDGSPRMVIDP